MTSALDLLMDSDSAAETTTLLESNGICTIDSRTRTIFVPPEIVVGAVQSDKNAERIKFSCPKIVGDNLDLSIFSIRINFENVSSVDPDISIINLICLMWTVCQIALYHLMIFKII